MACIDASMSKINWEDHCALMKSCCWSMIHGDYHPIQMMWGKISQKVVVLDMESVGFGNPGVDLGCFMI
jgi:aminoglycoside phosphotransferase (APT) family kinase protein